MLFSPSLVLGLGALPKSALHLHVSCGQEFLSKGNVKMVEREEMTSEKNELSLLFPHFL